MTHSKEIRYFIYPCQEYRTCVSCYLWGLGSKEGIYSPKIFDKHIQEKILIKTGVCPKKVCMWPNKTLLSDPNRIVIVFPPPLSKSIYFQGIGRHS